MVHAQHSVIIWDALDSAYRTWTSRSASGSDVARVRESYERMIHSELSPFESACAHRDAICASSVNLLLPVLQAPAFTSPAMDYSRFANDFAALKTRFAEAWNFTGPFSRTARNVRRVRLRRGELLETMRDAGVHARGIDHQRMNSWRSVMIRDSKRRSRICSEFLAAQARWRIRRAS